MNERELSSAQCRCDVEIQKLRVKDAENMLSVTKDRLAAEANEKLLKLENDVERERLFLKKERNRLAAAQKAEQDFTDPDLNT